jgi:hypothetical protein
MSLTLRQKLLLASIVACALLSSVRSLDSAPTESRETLAEFLASRPLVVVGRVVRVTGQDDRPIGVGCGVTGLISLRVTDMQLRVEEVLEGVAEDTLLDVAVVGHDLAKQFDPGLFGPGARVLFWGDRFCEMPWRTSGGIVVVRNDDSLLPTRSDWASESFHPNGWQSLEYLYALRLDLETFRDRSGTSSYRGAGAIALAVVKEVDFDGASVSYVCDSLGWVWASRPGCRENFDGTREFTIDARPIFNPATRCWSQSGRGTRAARSQLTPAFGVWKCSTASCLNSVSI